MASVSKKFPQSCNERNLEEPEFIYNESSPTSKLVECIRIRSDNKRFPSLMTDY